MESVKVDKRKKTSTKKPGVRLFFEISEKSWDLLKKIKEAKSIEFRDPEYRSVQEFTSSPEYSCKTRNKEWFLKRNYCNQDDLEELFKYQLIESDGLSWHPTYEVSKLGHEILKNNQ